MKAILLVRVSTEKQDFTEQENEIYQMAIADGYKPEDIIPICEKESGIKLEEEDRAGLNQMKKYIESGIGVNCVYCWEVSRIARRKKINFSVLEYLTSHKVQLVIKNPSIRLFNVDGSINEGAEVVFTLFSQMAESEMRTKKERFKRSKDAMRKQGYYTGGFVMYGYQVAEDGKLVINPEEAEIVKMVFTMYLSGKYSYRSLTKELRSMGYFADTTFNSANMRVLKMLTNTAYAGKPSSESGNKSVLKTGNIYPPIVTMETIEQCDKIAQNNRIDTKKTVRNIYFGKALLRCPKCGKIMVAHKVKNSYRCTKCDSKLNININIIDSALWACATPLYTARMQNKDEGEKQYYESQIVVLSQKVDIANGEVATMKDNIEKLEYRAFVENTMDVAKADKFIAEINKKIDAKNKEIEEAQNQIQTYKNLLLEKSGEYVGEQMDEVSQITDDKIRTEIIHQMIKWCTVDKVEGIGRRYFFTAYDYLDNKHQYLLDTHNHKIYSEYTNEGLGITEMEGAYIERFLQRYKAKGNYEEKKEKAKQARLYKLENDPEFAKRYKESQQKAQLKYRQRKKAQTTTDNEH